MPGFMNGESSCWPQDIGIVAIDVYFPSLCVEQSELEKYDGVSEGKYTIGLGQTRMAVCTDSEDINSLCLTVLNNLVEKTHISYKDIGWLGVGTETLVDKSKSVKTALMQLFVESGNHDVEGVDTTNACYGGTAALFNAVAWAESSAWDGRYAVVVTADIAIYAKGPARPTGGCGAVALLIGPNAPLVIGRGTRATYMNHVYDFYKPDMASEYARVDGKLSLKCYISALDNCYTSFRQKVAKYFKNGERTKPLSLEDVDAVLFHSPYCKLVQKALARMVFIDLLHTPKNELTNTIDGLESYRNLSLEETLGDVQLEKALVSFSKKIFEEKTAPGLHFSKEIGNMYTASLYGCLISYLTSKSMSAIAGKNILLYSYGSGLAASMFSISISKDCSPNSSLDKLLSSLRDVRQRLDERKRISPAQFTEILEHREEYHNAAPHKPSPSNITDLYPGTFYLTHIDDQFRRFYHSKAAAVQNGHSKVETNGKTNGVHSH